MNLERILLAGSLAPSADNSQPWLFEPQEKGLRLWLDTSRSDSLSDVDRVLTHLSCGAVIQNMVIAGNALGYEASVTLFPESGNRDLVCQIEWVPGPAHGHALADAIPKRHTNRRFFHRRPLPSELLASLAGEVRKIAGVQLLWMDTPKKRSVALHVMRLAERERFRRRALHEELFGSIRFDVGWRKTVEEGLPPGALEVEPVARPLFRGLRSWRITDALNNLGLYRAMGWRVADLPSRFAPALGVLTIDPETTVVDGGRAMERLWLAATVEGIAFQPLAAAGILPLQLRQANPAVPVPVLQDLADSLAALAEGGVALVFLRLGWASAPSLVAGRRDPRSFDLRRHSDSTGGVIRS